MRTLLFLLTLALSARAQMHPSLPEPGTLDGLGVNIHFTEPQPGELEMIRVAGFRWVRMDFTWAATEPEPGRYDFAKYDSLVAALEKAGLRAYFILDYGHPKFADAGDKQPFTSRAGTQEFRDAFAKWAVAAVGHFKGRGIVWELWNEPNIAGFWKPKPDVQQYIALAKTVAAALEKAGLRGSSRTFPGGTKRAAAGECLVGPATSVIDLPFLDACFAAGLLEVFDAISVHPYRQGAPESVAEEYRALRLLIRRHCSADALSLGTFDPSRPNPARRIPILSGEWGYSAAWPSLGKDEAAREATQAKYLPRMFLTNVANDIPLSIWYDWRDDGGDPKEAEHRFGIVRRKPTGDAKQPFEPKPAYTAMKVMGEELKGMKFSKELHGVRLCGTTMAPICHLYSGERGQRLVQWITFPEGMDATIWLFGEEDVNVVSTDLSIARDGKLGSLPYGFPSVYRSNNPTGSWRLLSEWPRLPLDYVKGGFVCELTVEKSMINPLVKVVYRLQGFGPTDPDAKVSRIDPGARVRWFAKAFGPIAFDPLGLDRPFGFLTDQVPLSIHDSLNNGFRDAGFQNAAVVTQNVLTMICFPPGKDIVPVRIINPGGHLAEITATLQSRTMDAGKQLDHAKETIQFSISSKEKETLIRFPWSHPYQPEGVSFSNSKTGEYIAWARAPKLISSGFQATAQRLTVHPDGDAAVASTQSLADGQPAEGASVSGTPSVGLRYRFGAGWKFVRIEPKDAAARKIEGEPRAFGIWVHGDGQGGTPCIRLRDATGQVHQVRGEPVSWKGWRYVTFPLRPAADNGQTMIPLPDAGAEQRVSWSHWGGANDGVVHLPIEWDTLFLLDGNRQAMEGEIFLSAPTLVY